MDDLAGTGFNSTCKTCDNHYSVMFVDGISGGTTSAQGFVYQKQDQGSNDYILRIDIDSLKANGVTSGDDLAEALVDITSECYDFHYTQYASEGSKLYIYDDRESTSGTRDATFDTVPYYAIDMGAFDVTMNTSDGRSIRTEYTYDFGDAADQVHVEMVLDPSGQGDYVKKADGTYTEYKAADYPDPDNQPDRYSMEISYDKKDGSPAADIWEAAKCIEKNAYRYKCTAGCDRLYIYRCEGK